MKKLWKWWDIQNYSIVFITIIFLFQLQNMAVIMKAHNNDEMLFGIKY